MYLVQLIMQMCVLINLLQNTFLIALKSNHRFYLLDFSLWRSYVGKQKEADNKITLHSTRGCFIAQQSLMKVCYNHQQVYNMLQRNWGKFEALLFHKRLFHKSTLLGCRNKIQPIGLLRAHN